MPHEENKVRWCLRKAEAKFDHQIRSKIFPIRNVQVMIDSDLAALYDVDTKTLNRAVKRNLDRFPETFMFQLDESEILRFQIGTSSSRHGGRRYAPYAFTEQGVAMLSAVLKSKTAIRVSIQIMNAFVNMRRYLTSNELLINRLDIVERKQLEHDHKFELVFKAIEAKGIKPEKGIFYNGEIFDAYMFVADLIRSAKKSIVLIDNYVDDSVLTFLCKRSKGVKTTIYTKEISKLLELDLKRHNCQYDPVEIKIFKHSHDRFLIIDDREVYHIGASLKDLGKKWFAFSRFDKEAIKMIEKINDPNPQDRNIQIFK